jgi:hypothetical protein
MVHVDVARGNAKIHAALDVRVQEDVRGRAQVRAGECRRALDTEIGFHIGAERWQSPVECT